MKYVPRFLGGGKRRIDVQKDAFLKEKEYNAEDRETASELKDKF